MIQNLFKRCKHLLVAISIPKITKIPTPAKQKSGKSINWYSLPQISPVLSLKDHGSCEVAATPLRPQSERRGMYCRRFCSYRNCFTNISCIFAPKELKRGSEGGISLSTKSRHLPLRKQFHHDSSGKSYKQSLLRLLCFYGCTSIAVILCCLFPFFGLSTKHTFAF